MADADPQGHRVPDGKDVTRKPRLSQDFYQRRSSAALQRRASEEFQLKEPLPEIGAHVVAKPRDQEFSGIVRYAGTASFADGIFIGMELSEAKGKHDGSVQGVKYFSCPDGHGVFVRPQHLTSVQPPEHHERKDSEDSSALSDVTEKLDILDLDITDPDSVKHGLAAAMEEPNLMHLRLLLPVAATVEIPESEMQEAQSILTVHTQASLVNDIEDLRVTMSGIVDSMKAEQSEFNRVLAATDANECAQMLARRSREGIRSMQEAVMEKTQELVGLASEFVNFSNEPHDMIAAPLSHLQTDSIQSENSVAEQVLRKQLEEMHRRMASVEAERDSFREAAVPGGTWPEIRELCTQAEMKEAKYEEQEARAENDRLHGELQDSLSKLVELRTQNRDLELLRADRERMQSRAELDLKQQLDQAAFRHGNNGPSSTDVSNNFHGRGTLLHDELAGAHNEIAEHKKELLAMERQHDYLEAEASVYFTAMAARPLGGDKKERCLALAEEYRAERVANKADQARELEHLREQVAALRQKLKEQEQTLAPSAAGKGSAKSRGVTPPIIRSGLVPRPSITASTSPTLTAAPKEPASKPSYWEQLTAVFNGRSGEPEEKKNDPPAVVVLSLTGDGDRKVTAEAHVASSRSPTFGSRHPKNNETRSGTKSSIGRTWSRGRKRLDKDAVLSW